MIADTEAELHAMADRIGVARRWYQVGKIPLRYCAEQTAACGRGWRGRNLHGDKLA